MFLMQNRSIYLLNYIIVKPVTCLLVSLSESYLLRQAELEDRKMTPRSCLDEDSELKLLTRRCETTSVQSLPQSVRLLQSQLKAERLASA